MVNVFTQTTNSINLFHSKIFMTTGFIIYFTNYTNLESEDFFSVSGYFKIKSHTEDFLQFISMYFS